MKPVLNLTNVHYEWTAIVLGLLGIVIGLDKTGIKLGIMVGIQGIV